MSKNTKAKAKTAAPAAAPAASAAAAPTAKEAEEPSEPAADSGDEAGADSSKKTDKKKKDKKAAKKKEEPVISAQGRAILLRKQQLEAEEARIKKLQEEEEERIRQEEERELQARLAIEAEKEKKRKAKQDKIDRQKEAGTYMTKGEKERQRKQQARLDAMKAASSLIIPGTAAAIEAAKKQEERVAARELSKKEEEEESSDDDDEDDKAVAAAAASAAAADMDDDWESGDWEANVDKISAKVEELVVQAKALEEDSVEDLIVLDKKKENDKLRTLGIERAKREEELRLKKEEEERERREMEQRAYEEKMRKESARRKRLERERANLAARTAEKLRSPICCIMGHVDTGKTKLLDKIRHTNVQEGEAGGITQQIGATKFPRETLAQQTAGMLRSVPDFNIRLPGLLVIDTPGHESFSNLRNRGSTLCDIAILVIDLMHGLEQQTIESLNMLLQKNTPFVVALNKVDRCYGWKTCRDMPIREALAVQDENCILEFQDRSQRIMVQLSEKGVNSKLYWDMKAEDVHDNYIPLIPTSAISGEGVPDLLMNLITKTQDEQTEKMMYCENLQCTVLEVKVLEGLGHTVDVVLVNGTLREGDTIVVSTLEGPVVTNIRALLTPPPNREMRVRSEYEHHEVLSGSIGVKIVAPDISRAIAGTPIMVVQPEDDIDDVKEECQSDLKSVLTSLETDDKGVIVHASTLGALEALLHFLRVETKPKIPVIHVTIGPIHKKDVMRAGIMHDKGSPEYATILAFDVKVDSEAAAMAEELNVRIFTAEIIYHLFDQFSAYMNGITSARREAAMSIAVHPVVLKILPNHIFNKKDPIVLGVEILEGTLKVGTPLCVPALSLDVGKVTRIENNHKEVQSAKKGTSVAVQITNEGNPTITYGRQFDSNNSLYSKISRQSIDALKEFFKEEVSKEDWGLVVKLKKVFNIP